MGDTTFIAEENLLSSTNLEILGNWLLELTQMPPSPLGSTYDISYPLMVWDTARCINEEYGRYVISKRPITLMNKLHMGVPWQALNTRDAPHMDASIHAQLKKGLLHHLSQCPCCLRETLIEMREIVTHRVHQVIPSFEKYVDALTGYCETMLVFDASIYAHLVRHIQSSVIQREEYLNLMDTLIQSPCGHDISSILEDNGYPKLLKTIEKQPPAIRHETMEHVRHCPGCMAHSLLDMLYRPIYDYALQTCVPLSKLPNTTARY